MCIIKNTTDILNTSLEGRGQIQDNICDPFKSCNSLHPFNDQLSLTCFRPCSLYLLAFFLFRGHYFLFADPSPVSAQTTKLKM